MDDIEFDHIVGYDDDNEPWDREEKDELVDLSLSTDEEEINYIIQQAKQTPLVDQSKIIAATDTIINDNVNQETIVDPIVDTIDTTWEVLNDDHFTRDF